MAYSATHDAEPQTVLQPRLRRLKNNEELTRTTTKHMVGTLEWSAPVFQSLVLFVSGIYDPYSSYGRVIVLCLAFVNLLVIPLYYRGYGPFAMGGRWVLLCILQCVIINAVLELLSRPHTYGDHITCVPDATMQLLRFSFWHSIPGCRWWLYDSVHSMKLFCSAHIMDTSSHLHG